MKSLKMAGTRDLQVLPDTKIIYWALVVGAVGGALGLLYYLVLKFLLNLIWARGVGTDWLELPFQSGFHPKIIIATTVGGFFVGLSLKYLGQPGEIAAVVDNIHMEEGRIDIKQTPSMIVCSLLSITAGGSAGPEAPLVQMIGSAGSWIGDRLKLRSDQIRTLTFCGMATALGAFFGAPLGGALFALEIPHRSSLEYYEALVPSILASIAGFLVFRSVLGYNGGIYHFASVALLGTEDGLRGLYWAVFLGLAGGVVALLFSAVFRGIGVLLHPFARFPVILASFGGLVLGALAQLSPKTLFWGEFQVDSLLKSAPQFLSQYGVKTAVLVLLALAFLKIVAIGFTLHSGFRGGFIFPLFFVGAAVGIAISLVFPSIPLALSVVCVMAAINVAVTKTPISTTVILATITGTTFLPALTIASFTSFVLTTRLSVISTQRSRSN
jgi:H+/Cl- antiporter ClcA